jgi:hypothetical protein
MNLLLLLKMEYLLLPLLKVYDKDEIIYRDSNEGDSNEGDSNEGDSNEGDSNEDIFKLIKFLKIY